MEVYASLLLRIGQGPLQWGHDKIVMEVQHVDVPLDVHTQLQWGHDKIVMEVTQTHRAELEFWASFNGAMTK